MPDGRRPEPGGWNRMVVTVDDLAGWVAELREAGVPFRNDVVSGPGGQQILCEDPSGNVVELFEPAGSGPEMTKGATRWVTPDAGAGLRERRPSWRSPTCGWRPGSCG